ncbi:MAG TPA: maleylpyruvate isomerase family mycothiol-dependent enzyme [Ilumatobacteraceae bacterium]|nr:maleylpyruvate isomerase family mycothiol-dependent enzyme [Ilumatobacteraceae bacterium]
MDDTATWKLIHKERAAIADTLTTLTAEQWATPSLCGGWSVRETAAHIVLGAEQTTPHFLGRMAANGFRFNTMMDRDARRTGVQAPDELIARLRARVTTTNKPPAPAMTMLGEVVVHGDDIRRPLGLENLSSPDVLIACLEMYKNASFPVGTKKRIDGLRLVATDVDWSHGTGPEVTGPAMSIVMAMTGRAAGLDELGSEGLATLRRRMTPTK